MPGVRRAGAVDLHHFHSIWSLVYLTSWKSEPRIGCARCARIQQLKAMAFSGLFGWWGFPWGVIMTPVQLVRNTIGIVKAGRNDPFDELQRTARLEVATARLIALQLHQAGQTWEDAAQISSVASS